MEFVETLQATLDNWKTEAADVATTEPRKARLTAAIAEIETELGEFQNAADLLAQAKAEFRQKSITAEAELMVEQRVHEQAVNLAYANLAVADDRIDTTDLEKQPAAVAEGAVDAK
jgi:hypothetical protein